MPMIRRRWRATSFGKRHAWSKSFHPIQSARANSALPAIRGASGSDSCGSPFVRHDERFEPQCRHDGLARDIRGPARPGMNTWARLIASGVFVALIPLGLVIARRAFGHRPVDAVALAVPMAIAALSLPLLAAAVIGHFSPLWNGAVCWLVTAASAALLRRPSMGHEMRAAVTKHAVAGCPWLRRRSFIRSRSSKRPLAVATRGCTRSRRSHSSGRAACCSRPWIRSQPPPDSSRPS